MRPLRLLLDGFGSYREPTDIDFSDVDFFALVGPTGSGKSTVIDGLCFALYGTVPRWGKENVITHALAPSANSCRVGLVFDASGARYAAVRVLSRDNKGRVHTKEARLDRLDSSIPANAPLPEILQASVAQIAEGPDQLTAEVTRLLGLSYEHFTQCVLLPQGKFAEFLQAKATDRQDLLVQLLAYGVYEQIGQRARDRARLAVSRRDVAHSQRKELADATEQAEQSAEARLATLTALGHTIDAYLETVTALQGEVTDAARQADTSRDQAQRLTAIRMPDEVPRLAARIASTERTIGELTSRRDELDKSEVDTEQARRQLPDKARLVAVGDAYASRRALRNALDTQRAALRRLEAVEQAAVQDVADAERAVEATQQVLAATRQAHAAAALAQTLRVGDACPVCLQPVTTLPHQLPPAGLQDAAAAVEQATDRHKDAQAAAATTGKKAEAGRTTAATTEQRLADLAGQLVSAPDEEAVATCLADIETADAALESVRAAARTARAAVEDAQAARKKLGAEERRAWATLRSARDGLVALGAPPVDGTDLADAWQALLGWAATERTSRSARQPDLDAAAAGLRAQVDGQVNVLTVLLTEHGIRSPGDPTQMPLAVVEHRVLAEQNLAAVRKSRIQAATLDTQIAGYREQEQVASLLGGLLKATAFERWLCGEALDSLVAEASKTLLELSESQYELDRTDHNDLVVIDYNDAGTRRPVNTLSGGETFQASLALSLALSHQVVGLSAGMQDLNAMFLDEGFGTLDENTLDTVADTLERLALDKDRMVGIVTHVAALADRVRVQFTVSRDGATSRLRKVRI